MEKPVLTLFLNTAQKGANLNMFVLNRVVNYARSKEEGIIPFLFGTRERAFFSLWYVVILTISMLWHAFSDEQWVIILGGPLKEIVFMVVIIGLLGGSTGYWLFMSVYAFFRPSKDWPILPPKKYGVKGALVNIFIFLVLLIPAIMISDGALRFITFIGYSIWAVASVYFLFTGFQTLLAWGETNFRPIPKTSNPILTVLFVIVINVISLPIILLLAALYNKPLILEALLMEGFILAFFLMLLTLNTFTFVLVIYFWFKDRIKIQYIPIFHLFVLLYLIFIVIKTMLVDTEGATLESLAFISNILLILVLLFLGLRKMAKLVGSLGEEQYKKRLNPRTVRLMLFYLTAVYLAVIELRKIFMEVILMYIQPILPVLANDLLIFVQNLFITGPNWILFSLFAPLGYALFFLTVRFAEEPEAKE